MCVNSLATLWSHSYSHFEVLEVVVEPQVTGEGDFFYLRPQKRAQPLSRGVYFKKRHMLPVAMGIGAQITLCSFSEACLCGPVRSCVHWLADDVPQLFWSILIDYFIVNVVLTGTCARYWWTISPFVLSITQVVIVVLVERTLGCTADRACMRVIIPLLSVFSCLQVRSGQVLVCMFRCAGKFVMY